MSTPLDLTEMLACPRCDRTPLAKREGAYHCDGCKVAFPLIGGLLWAFAEPTAALAEWRARWHFTLRMIEQRIARIEALVAGGDLRPEARARLERRLTAEHDHCARLRSVLAPLMETSTGLRTATYLALRTRLPPDQGLLTYYANIHRDWAWGDDENAASIELVTRVLRPHRPGRSLVLGAGAGRLAYDLHRSSGAHSTFALDFNPLLCFVGARAAAGDTLELYEFPLAPRSAAEQVVLRRLHAPEPAPRGLEWIIADIHRPPFAPQSFDTVVTPWLVDIVPERLEAVADRINRLLAPDGIWINFGSLSFADADLAAQYDLDECRALLESRGYAELRLETQTMPYMCSPASRHGRREEVVAWSATKREHVNQVERYEALPDWLVRGQSPVPRSNTVAAQAMSAQVHGFLLSLIDGQRSLKDIARIAAERHLVPSAESESTIRSFLTKVYDEGRKLGV